MTGIQNHFLDSVHSDRTMTTKTITHLQQRRRVLLACVKSLGWLPLNGGSWSQSVQEFWLFHPVPQCRLISLDGESQIWRRRGGETEIPQ